MANGHQQAANNGECWAHAKSKPGCSLAVCLRLTFPLEKTFDKASTLYRGTGTLRKKPDFRVIFTAQGLFGIFTSFLRHNVGEYSFYPLNEAAALV